MGRAAALIRARTAERSARPMTSGTRLGLLSHLVIPRGSISRHDERTRCAMPKIVPNFWYDAEAEAAAEHYVSIFPNSRVVSVTRYNEAGPREAGMVMT